MGAGVKRPAGNAIAATIVEVAPFHGFFTQQQLCKFSCGCEFAHAILAGEYKGVRDLVPDEGAFEVSNCFFLAEDVS
jgi:hypothetical protein